MELPPFPAVTPEAIDAICRRAGIPRRSCVPLPRLGIFNLIYLLNDELVLRVPRDAPPFTAAIDKESVVIPAARAAGVRTPEVVAYDPDRAVLPVPYLISRRVPGTTLSQTGLDAEATPTVWSELGHDLALLHTRAGADQSTVDLEVEPLPDPRATTVRLAEAGFVTTAEARWFDAWLARLAPAAAAAREDRLCHGDTQSTNVMVDPETLTYHAVIDWGAAGWTDPAHDFAGIPLRAVPYLLDGYRRVAPVPDDERAEARILWRHLQIALWLSGRRPQPELSWAERPLAMLVDVLRFVADPPDGRWADLVPRRIPG